MPNCCKKPLNYSKYNQFKHRNQLISVYDVHISKVGYQTRHTRMCCCHVALCVCAFNGGIVLPNLDKIFHSKGHTLRVIVPFCRTDNLRSTYFPWGVNLRNSEPKHIASAQGWRPSREDSWEYLTQSNENSCNRALGRALPRYNKIHHVRQCTTERALYLKFNQ